MTTCDPEVIYAFTESSPPRKQRKSFFHCLQDSHPGIIFSFITIVIIIFIVKLDYTMLNLVSENLNSSKMPAPVIEIKTDIVKGEIEQRIFTPQNETDFYTNTNYSILSERCEKVYNKNNFSIHICKPEFRDDVFFPGEINFSFNNKIVTTIIGERCNLFINWLRSCSRPDLVACHLEFSGSKRYPKCYIRSMFSQEILICFNHNYKISELSVKGHTFHSREASELVDTVLKYFE